jgi:anhydro-N-acetylmuramic acid kinase
LPRKNSLAADKRWSTLIMIVAGVMSGTSADGIDVAVVRVLGRGFRTRFQLLAHQHYAYPAAVRKAVLAAMNAQSASVADLARLNFLLGELYADAVNATAKKHTLKLDLVGCHGQTLYHQGDAASFLGRKVACTWQTGEGSIVAAKCGVPAISDFRPADMAAGGTGAPLVPFLDYILFRHARRGRIVQNIGGIGNLSVIPAAAKAEQVVAFDTGPGNMVMDQVMERLYSRSYDKDGAVAAKGKSLEVVASEVLNAKFFRRKPPKTAGREEFGREFVDALLKRCGNARNEDIVATATEITARSIAEAVRSVLPHDEEPKRFHDYIVSGGGTRNKTLMQWIRRELEPFGLRIRTTDDMGLLSEAKEAVAFAVLAYQTWRREPSNIPSATGASRPAILGKVSYV